MIYELSKLILPEFTSLLEIDQEAFTNTKTSNNYLANIEFKLNCVKFDYIFGINNIKIFKLKNIQIFKYLMIIFQII